VYPVAEFRRRCFRAIRRGLFTLVAAIATVALFAATALRLSESWHRYDPTNSILLVWGTLAAAGLTLLFESLWRHSRHPFTRCPHCRRPLTDFVPVVAASGCCYSCGKRVLEAHEETPDDALIPRAEFLAADTGYQTRAAPVLVGGVFATYLGCGGALVVVERTHLPDAVGVVVFLALAAVAPVSAIAVLRWIAAAAKRNPALACPSCGKLLAGARMTVAATGNCTACGCWAIVPRTRPLPPPHLGPMWTVAKITERVNERQRRYWWYVKKRPLVWITPLVTGYLTAWACFFLLTTSIPARWAGWPSEREREHRSVAVGGVGFVVVAVVAVRWVVRTAHRRHPIDCPRCGREMLVPFARATRCCNQCGWRAVQ
jgi:hypothetical protein